MATKKIAVVTASKTPKLLTYPAWFYRKDGQGFLIRDATHHLDYPDYTADSPAVFGIETAPAAKKE
jgi:hypothetical protein